MLNLEAAPPCTAPFRFLFLFISLSRAMCAVGRIEHNTKSQMISARGALVEVQSHNTSCARARVGDWPPTESGLIEPKGDWLAVKIS